MTTKGLHDGEILTKEIQPPATVRVVFCNAYSKGVTKLRKGFQHCFLLVYDRTIHAWLLVDPTSSGTRVTILGYNAAAALIRGMSCTVLEHKDWKFNASRRGFLNTCVEMVKGCLCLKSKALTPYQLYKDLLKHSFTERKDYL